MMACSRFPTCAGWAGRGRCKSWCRKSPWPLRCSVPIYRSPTGPKGSVTPCVHPPGEWNLILSSNLWSQRSCVKISGARMQSREDGWIYVYDLRANSLWVPESFPSCQAPQIKSQTCSCCPTTAASPYLSSIFLASILPKHHTSGLSHILLWQSYLYL